MSTPPADPWHAVEAARLPAAALGALAGVRAAPGVRVHLCGDTAWLTWDGPRPDVVRAALAAPGVALFTRSDAGWVPFGRRVVTVDRPPDGDGVPLAQAVVPARVEPAAPPAERPALARLTIARGGPPRPAAALACDLADVSAWADRATTRELAAVRAARSGARVVLLGESLPALPGVRYWGGDVLTPLGHRPDPDLPPAAVRAAVGADPDELIVLDAGRATVIPHDAFAPLTRAGVRLAGVRVSAEVGVQSAESTALPQ